MKKLVLGLVAAMAVLPSLIFSAWPSQAHAAGAVTASSVFSWQDAGTITTDVGEVFYAAPPSGWTSTVSGTNMGQAINPGLDRDFVDDNVSDKPHGLLYVSSTATGCNAAAPGIAADINNNIAISEDDVKVTTGGFTIPDLVISQIIAQQIVGHDTIFTYPGSGNTIPGRASGYLFAWRQDPGTSHCTPDIFNVQIPIGQTANGSIYYNWSDSGTISMVAGAYQSVSYSNTVDAQNPTHFIANATHDGESSCLDYIVPTPSGVGHALGGTTATYYFRYSGTTKNPASPSQVPNAFSLHGNMGINAQKIADPLGQNCIAYAVPITLGQLANQALAPGSSGVGAGSPVAAICDVGSFSWLACPAITAIDQAIGTVEKLIQDQLKFTPLTAGSTLYPVWASFRNLADVAFVLLFMLVIIGTAMGLDNYSVKKVLPRLIAAAVLIQFSWIFVGLAVDISNILGAGIGSLVSLNPAAAQAGSGDTSKVVAVLEGGAAGAVVLGVGVAFGSALLVPLLLTIGSLLISLLLAFLTLQVRVLLIDILVVLAPVAIIAWVLPNTESLFNKWRKLLTDLLLLYPVIMLLFLAGALFSVVGANIDPTTPGGTDVAKLIAALGPIITFAMVPATIKAVTVLARAGEHLASKTGANKGRGAMDNLRKNNAENTKQKAIKKLGEYQKEPPKGLDRLRARGAMSQAGFGFRSKEGIGKNPIKESQMLGKVAAYESAEQAGFTRKFQGQDAAAILTRIKDPKSSSAERKAALGVLAKNPQNDGELSKLLQEQYGGNASHPEWKAGIAGSTSELLARSPHLVKGTGAAAGYENMGIEQLSSLSASGHDDLREYISRTGGAGGAAGQNVARIITELNAKAQRTGTTGLKGDAIGRIDQLGTIVNTTFIPTPTATRTTPASQNVPPVIVQPQQQPQPGPNPLRPQPLGTPPVPPHTGQNPHLTERLIDPHVEGDTDTANPDNRII